MFVWTTSLPLFPIRVKTSDRSAERETPATVDPRVAPTPRRPAEEAPSE